MVSNVNESNQNETFAVDGQLLMILPRAGASIKNPDVQLPIFHKGPDGYFLEMQVKGDPTNKSEIAVTRRIPLTLSQKKIGRFCNTSMKTWILKYVRRKELVKD